jgi:AcrR family transcriptional regulator
MSTSRRENPVRRRSGEQGAHPYHHGDLRNALVEVGLRLLRDEGPEALSLREVAKRAGVSHAAPYRHFKDKEALLTELARQGFEELRAQVDAAIAGHADPKARLRAAMASYAAFGTQNPEIVHLMFGGAIATGAPGLKQAAQAAFSSLVEIVRAALPEARRPRADFVALALWAEAHGLLVLGLKLDLDALVPGSAPMPIAQAVMEFEIDAVLGEAAAGTPGDDAAR